MKKFMLLITGVMLAAALAACTPTAEKNKPKRSAPPEGAIQESVDGAAEKALPVNEDPVVTVCVYSIKEDKSGLQQNMDAIDGEVMDAQLLLDKMAEIGVVESGIKVEKFTQNGEAITLELSALGNSGDKQLQIAVVNTFLQNFDLDDGELTLIVAGEKVTEQPLKFNKEYKTAK